NGDADTNTPPTRLSGEWCGHVQEEIARAIELSGVELDPNNREQLAAIVTDKGSLTAANNWTGAQRFVGLVALNKSSADVPVTLTTLQGVGGYYTFGGVFTNILLNLSTIDLFGINTQSIARVTFEYIGTRAANGEHSGDLPYTGKIVAIVQTSTRQILSQNFITETGTYQLAELALGTGLYFGVAFDDPGDGANWNIVWTCSVYAARGHVF